MRAIPWDVIHQSEKGMFDFQSLFLPTEHQKDINLAFEL